jgi:hypothetical protein
MMNLINESNWTTAGGAWIANEHKLIQSDKTAGLITRAYQLIESNNFIASYKMKLSRVNNKVWGESKFIFSGADSGEDFRIDFIYTQNICRLTMGWMLGQPLQVGTTCELIEEMEYSIKITLKDNLLSVFVDGMNIFDNYKIGKRSNKYIGLGSYDAAVEFFYIEVLAYKETNCFVVMPFDYQRNFLYEYVIKPTLDKHHKYLFKHFRADESLTTGKISEEITDFINKSEIIIADITNKNPNVFYELGFAHCAKRAALLLIEKEEGKKLDIPFDIQDFRCYSYIFSKDGFEKLTETLNALLENMVRDKE